MESEGKKRFVGQRAAVAQSTTNAVSIAGDNYARSLYRQLLRPAAESSGDASARRNIERCKTAGSHGHCMLAGALFIALSLPLGFSNQV